MKRLVLCLLVCCLLAAFGGCAASERAEAETGFALSPALELLRGQTKLVRGTVRYEDLAFSRSDFCALTGEETEYIVIGSLPNADAGVLMLNGAAVIAGQTVPASSLDYLKFIPNSGDASEARFTFTAKAAGWESRELTAEIVLLDAENFPPVTSDMTLETFEDVACFADLQAADPNGDEVEFAITRYPKHGSLRLTDGRILYVPTDGYTGEDSFTYLAKDRLGASSAEKTVSISTVKNETGLQFADLARSPVHNAAIRLCSEQIMTYHKEGGEYYFRPEETVSKIDCLVMMMCLCGLTDQAQTVSATEVADAQALSAAKKGFLQTAISMNAVHLENGIFRPNEAVTAADAAYMAAALLGLPTLAPKQEFSDLSSTPAWACDALISADSAGIWKAENGALGASETLTRADLALLLENMSRYRA